MYGVLWIESLLQEIIARVLVAFPQQAVWMSMAVSKVIIVYFSKSSSS